MRESVTGEAMKISRSDSVAVILRRALHQVEMNVLLGGPSTRQCRRGTKVSSVISPVFDFNAVHSAVPNTWPLDLFAGGLELCSRGGFGAFWLFFKEPHNFVVCHYISTKATNGFFLAFLSPEKNPF